MSLEFWYPWSSDLGWEVQRFENRRITQVAPDNQSRNNQKKSKGRLTKKTWDYGFPGIQAILLDYSSEHLPFLHRGVGTWHHLTPDHGASSSQRTKSFSWDVDRWDVAMFHWLATRAWLENRLQTLEDLAQYRQSEEYRQVEDGWAWAIASLVPSWGLQNAAFFGIRPASMGIELIWLIRHDSCCYSGTTAGMFKSGWTSKNWR